MNLEEFFLGFGLIFHGCFIFLKHSLTCGPNPSDLHPCGAPWKQACWLNITVTVTALVYVVFLIEYHLLSLLLQTSLKVRKFLKRIAFFLELSGSTVPSSFFSSPAHLYQRSVNDQCYNTQFIQSLGQVYAFHMFLLMSFPYCCLVRCFSVLLPCLTLLCPLGLL